MDLFLLEEERVFVVSSPRAVHKADLVLVHGLTEHAGRYFPFARVLAGRGCRVILPCLAGHGGRENRIEDSWPLFELYFSASDTRHVQPGIERWKGDSGKPSFSAAITALRTTKWEAHICQLGRIFVSIRAVNPAVPLYLSGHSLGALICLVAVEEWAGRQETTPLSILNGLILLSPALAPKGRQGHPLETLAIRALWQLRRPGLLWFRSLLKTFGASVLRNRLLSYPPCVSDMIVENELYGQDPLILHQLPFSYLDSLDDLMVASTGAARPWPLDTLALMAENDTIIDSRAAIRQLVRRNGPEKGDTVQIKVFKSLHAHELLRSSARDEVSRLIINWLKI